MNLLFYFLEFLESEILSLLHEIDDEVDELIIRLPSSQLTETEEKDPALLRSNDSAPFRRLKGRRRAVNVKLMNELRIVKRDVRRRYIGMYNNVMNVHDHSLLLSFLRDLCTPSCSFTVCLPNNRRNHVWRGVPEIFLQIAHSQLKIPDGVQQLGNGRIHVSLGKPGSRIISSVSFKGRLLYQSHPETSSMKSAQLSLLKYSSSCPSSLKIEEDDALSAEKKKGDSQSSDHQSQAILGLLPLDLFPSLSQASKPKEIKATGIFTMILDDMNRIESFQMNFNHYYEEEMS